jgi:hypothetical protein
MHFRLPKIADGSPAYQMVGHKYRPRTTTLGAAIASTGATAVVLTDASPFMQGDVLKLASGEVIEVTADPVIATNTITVRRGVGGTTAATQLISTPVFLIGNSRSGAENAPTPISSGLTSTTQYAQTFQHPYSIGGGVQSNTLFPVAPGSRTPLEQYRMDSLQNAMDDMEMASCFGIAESMSAGANTSGRAKEAGLRSIIQTCLVTTPTNAGSYHAVDFQRDFLTKPRKNGGRPNACYLASNWMDAFATWGMPLQLIVAGQTSFGVDFTVYTAPFLGDVTIIEASLLPDFTGFSLTEPEIRYRVKRPLTDEPWGKRGDTTEGHMIGEESIEVDNEAHHAWIEGVTAFSA